MSGPTDYAKGFAAASRAAVRALRAVEARHVDATQQKCKELASVGVGSGEYSERDQSRDRYLTGIRVCIQDLISTLHVEE